MPNIKILTLSRKRTGSTLEPLQPALESWARFLRQYADRLEVLTLELFMWDDTDAQDAFKKHIVPLLKSGEFKRLKQIELLGATRLTPEDSTQIKGVLPSEVNFLWTPVFPVVASSSIPEYGFISPSSSFESLLPGPPTSGYLAPELGDSDYPPATGPSYYD
ncbi:hypothetical protein FRC03_010948 [Tulasnella sp. 419]|nr:hypothetical protein FRC03_010948 [Tulasnella sp. 419]